MPTAQGKYYRCQLPVPFRIRHQLVLKLREDVETQPIEVNFQSAGVSQGNKFSSLKTITKQRLKIVNAKSKAVLTLTTVRLWYNIMQYQ